VLARVPCQKIYVLGNHDNILQAVTGLYPLGAENLEVVGDAYPADDTGEIRPLRIGDCDSATNALRYTMSPLGSRVGARKGALS